MKRNPTLLQRCIAEVVGTFILVWIGPGAAVVAGLLGGVKSLTDVWAIGIAFGIAVAAIMLPGLARLRPAIPNAVP